MWSTLCEYGQHTIDMHPATMFNYADLKNGIAENTRTCPQCYLDHIRKFYPDNILIVKSLLADYPELT